VLQPSHGNVGMFVIGRFEKQVSVCLEDCHIDLPSEVKLRVSQEGAGQELPVVLL
jgi:hypothetical protein